MATKVVELIGQMAAFGFRDAPGTNRDNATRQFGFYLGGKEIDAKDVEAFNTFMDPFLGKKVKFTFELED